MPSKAAQIIAFLAVFTISALIHRFVYANLKRVIVRDYPKAGRKLARAARVLFIVMDLPFLYIYFRSGMPQSLVRTTTFLLYPFAVWQAIMLLWAVILVPFAAWRRTGAFGFIRVRDWLRQRKENEGEEIAFEAPLEVVTE